MFWTTLRKKAKKQLRAISDDDVHEEQDAVETQVPDESEELIAQSDEEMQESNDIVAGMSGDVASSNGQEKKRWIINGQTKGCIQKSR